ncbi:hypothetical protein ACFLXU_07770, partial [Chloroflexota bacterium]
GVSFTSLDLILKGSFSIACLDTGILNAEVQNRVDVAIKIHIFKCMFDGLGEGRAKYHCL